MGRGEEGISSLSSSSFFFKGLCFCPLTKKKTKKTTHLSGFIQTLSWNRKRKKRKKRRFFCNRWDCFEITYRFQERWWFCSSIFGNSFKKPPADIWKPTLQVGCWDPDEKHKTKLWVSTQHTNTYPHTRSIESLLVQFPLQNLCTNPLTATHHIS